MKIIDIPARDIPSVEYFDNRIQEFVKTEARHIDPIHLQLEHSLMSIRKWEAKWHEPFIDANAKLSGEKLLDYIRCMTVNPVKNPQVYNDLTKEALEDIIEYMQDPQSAWVINQKKKGGKKSRKPDTAETIYYAMIQFGIPQECEKWHFNQLMALIDYCDSKGGSTSGAGGPAKKSQKELMDMYRAINEKNRKKYNSKG